MKNNSKEIKMTYATLEQYASFPSNDYLMLCELIDNSISSYINQKHNPSGDVSELKIEININRNNINNSWLEIIDNANGMNYSQLDKCLEFGDKNKEAKDSPLNIYGVGLKQASFFLGKKLSILTFSKSTNQGLKTIIDIDEIKRSDDQVVRYDIGTVEGKIVTSSFESQSGTRIKIEKLRKGKLTKTKLESMVSNLRTKYYFYLLNGMSINVNLEEKNKITLKENIKPSLPLFDNTSIFLEEAQKHDILTGKSIKDFIKYIIDKIQLSKTISEESKEDFINKIRRGENLVWDIDETILNGIKISGKIGILAHKDISKHILGFSQTYVKYYGFTLFQANRAIMSGPNNKELGMSNYIENIFDDDISGSNNHKRRWFGYINLDNLYDAKNEDGDRIYLDLTSNKSGIQWLDEEARLKFNEVLKNHIEKYDLVFRTYFNAQNESLKVSNKTSNKITEQLNNSMNKNIVTLSEIDNKSLEANYIVKLLKDDSKRVNIKINIVTKMKNEDKLFDVFWKDIDSCVLSLNSKHPIWSPIVGEEIYDNIMIEMHKFAIVIALTDFVVLKKEEFEVLKKDERSIFNDLDIFEVDNPNSISDIFSYISNRICLVE